MMGKTKDEKFLIKLYELANNKKSWNTAIDMFLIGRSIGQNDKGIKTIVRNLCQSNFIKKNGERTVYLTENGLALIKELEGY